MIKQLVGLGMMAALVLVAMGFVVATHGWSVLLDLAIAIAFLVYILVAIALAASR